MLDSLETIAAIASRPGPAPRAIIRLSGPQALEIPLANFQNKSNEAIAAPKRPTCVSGRLCLIDPTLNLPTKLVLWPGPRSYTGQPVAEVHTIGSPPLLHHLLTHFLSQGARLAEPGEFTLRAFLSGRIDLSQSEAVLKVIEARSPRRLQSALEQLAGGVAEPLKLLRDRLLDRLVELEANLDFVDEPDVSPIVRQGLVLDLDQAFNTLETLLAHHRARDQTDARPRVVLIGKPNAGKSRLFNALLNREQAIVSPVAGTTRDYLTATCEHDGISFTLVDTAGEDEAASDIETAMQAQRVRQTAEADLILYCIPVDEINALITNDSASQSTLTIITKVDLEQPNISQKFISTSALTGRGLEDLRSAIADSLREQSQPNEASQVGSHWRESLERAAQALIHAREVASGPGGEELIAAELRLVIDDLGKVVGAVVTEDILDRIFRRFCIGK